MTLQQMYYITQVARYRSYSEAAKALFVSQSTLSLAIKDAESELHISIFDRSNKGIELTEEGTDFLTRIQDILDRSKNLEEYYLHRQLLGMRFSVSAQRLAFSVRAFNRLLESIDWDCYDVAMRECPTSNVISDVASGKSELGVLASEPHNFRLIQRSLNSNGLVFHELNQLASFVFLRKSHPLAARASVTFTDLREYPFVTYDQEADATYFSEEPVFYNRLSKNIHVTDRCTKISLIRNNNCFSIGPDLPNSSAGAMHTGMQEIVAIPLAEEQSYLHIGYICQKGHQLTDVAQRYISFLREEIEALEQALIKR